MGISISDLAKILDTSSIHLGDSLALSLTELGEQELKIPNADLNHPLISDFLQDSPRHWPPHAKPRLDRVGLFSKDFLSRKFANVISIDLKAHCPATKRLDLAIPLSHQGFPETFDVVTNFGTTEHVGQYSRRSMSPQYAAFQNIHNLIKPHGLMFHSVPFAKSRRNVQDHGAFNYDVVFFSALSDKLNYRVVYSRFETRGNLAHVDCCLQKINETPFLDEKFFNLLPGIFCTPHCLPDIRQSFKRDRSLIRRFF
jgi:hypothetical protein